jgi:mannosyltransferase
MTLVKGETATDSAPGAMLTSQPKSVRPDDAIFSGPRTALFVTAVTLIGAALRLHMLSAPSLWIDEASSVGFVVMRWWSFLRLLWGGQGNMTLYYLLLRGWIHLGDSEFVVRSLSVLFGVVTIPAVYLLGQRVFDRATGITAALLLSVHSFHVHWSQEARAYSLLTLLLVLTMYALISALESKQDQRRWIVLAVAAALCVYAHIFAVLVLSAFALGVVFPRPFRVSRRNIILTAGMFAFLVAPMAAFVALNRNGSQISWIPQPKLSDISEFLELLTSQGGIFLVMIYLAMCALAVFYSTKVTRPDKESWTIRLLALWLVLPPLLTLAASLIKPVFFARYLSMCVPALVLLAARGITRLYEIPGVRRWAAWAALVLIVVLSGSGVSRYFRDRVIGISDWRSATDYVLQREQPGDGAVFFIPNTYPYRYYTHRAEIQHRVKEAPEILYPPTPGQPLSREEVMNVTNGHKRVWLILHIAVEHPRETAIMESTLGELFQLREKRVFTGEDPITIELYSRVQTEH